MKCLICKKPLKKTEQLYHYTESGLDNVYLWGIDVFKCDKCGKIEAKIPRIDELNKVIVKCIISKPQRLINKEIKYLRKYMGFKAVELANILGVDKSTLSRWESGTVKIGIANDKLLRLIAIRYKDEQDYSIFPTKIIDTLKTISSDVPEKVKENRIQFDQVHQAYSCISV